jgi:hypothetical protein
MLFAKHKREEVKKGLAAGAPVTEVAKALGALWKKLPDVRPPPSNILWRLPLRLALAGSLSECPAPAPFGACA